MLAHGKRIRVDEGFFACPEEVAEAEALRTAEDEAAEEQLLEAAGYAEQWLEAEREEEVLVEEPFVEEVEETQAPLFSGHPWLSAELLLTDWRFDVEGRRGRKVKPHVIIMGMTQCGNCLMLNAVLDNFDVTLGEWPYQHDEHGRRTKHNLSGCIHLVDFREVRGWRRQKDRSTCVGLPDIFDIY